MMKKLLLMLCATANLFAAGPGPQKMSSGRLRHLKLVFRNSMSDVDKGKNIPGNLEKARCALEEAENSASLPARGWAVSQSKRLREALTKHAGAMRGVAAACPRPEAESKLEKYPVKGKKGEKVRNAGDAEVVAFISLAQAFMEAEDARNVARMTDLLNTLDERYSDVAFNPEQAMQIMEQTDPEEQKRINADRNAYMQGLKRQQLHNPLFLVEMFRNYALTAIAGRAEMKPGSDERSFFPVREGESESEQERKNREAHDRFIRDLQGGKEEQANLIREMNIVIGRYDERDDKAGLRAYQIFLKGVHDDGRLTRAQKELIEGVVDNIDVMLTPPEELGGEEPGAADEPEGKREREGKASEAARLYPGYEEMGIQPGVPFVPSDVKPPVAPSLEISEYVTAFNGNPKNLINNEIDILVFAVARNDRRTIAQRHAFLAQVPQQQLQANDLEMRLFMQLTRDYRRMLDLWGSQEGNAPANVITIADDYRRIINIPQEQAAAQPGLGLGGQGAGAAVAGAQSMAAEPTPEEWDQLASMNKPGVKEGEQFVQLKNLIRKFIPYLIENLDKNELQTLLDALENKNNYFIPQQFDPKKRTLFLTVTKTTLGNNPTPYLEDQYRARFIERIKAKLAQLGGAPAGGRVETMR